MCRFAVGADETSRFVVACLFESGFVGQHSGAHLFAGGSLFYDAPAE
jgi:hypothetical protein